MFDLKHIVILDTNVLKSIKMGEMELAHNKSEPV